MRLRGQSPPRVSTTRKLDRHIDGEDRKNTHGEAQVGVGVSGQNLQRAKARILATTRIGILM